MRGFEAARSRRGAYIRLHVRFMVRLGAPWLEAMQPADIKVEGGRTPPSCTKLEFSILNQKNSDYQRSLTLNSQSMTE
jgi:hypothetical protein